MKMSKKILSIISGLLIVTLLLSGCTASKSENSTPESDKLTLYVVKNDPMIRLFKAYNNHDTSGIELVEFEDNTKLDSKLATELMAGKGPDLVLYSSMYNGVSNIEKMIAQDKFADINELMDDSEIEKLKNECNETVLNTGIYNNKRCLLPISYFPDMMITTKEICDEYSIDLNNPITYKNAENVLSKFLDKGKKTDDMSVFNWINHSFYGLIDSNIDFFTRTNSLQSEDFLFNSQVIHKLILPCDKKEVTQNYDPLDLLADGNIMFVSLDDIVGAEPNSLAYVFYYLKQNNKTPIILPQISDNKNHYSAFVDKGFLINKSSSKKDEAYKFIKYMLNEETQSAAEIGLPVNKSAQSKLIEEMNDETLNKEISNDASEGGIIDDFRNSYVEFLNRINYCTIRNDYYNNHIINDIVSGYISGKITNEQFTKEIHSKTKIYLEE